MTTPAITVEVSNHCYLAKVIGGAICVDMGKPKLLKGPITLPFQNRDWTWHLVDTGVPHLITVVPHMEDVTEVGRYFRHHPDFSPHGANVNFVTLTPTYTSIRTYERGVERETLACGTGATACAYILHTLYKLPADIIMTTRSQELLEVLCQENSYWLKGPTQFVRSGSIEYRDLQHVC